MITRMMLAVCGLLLAMSSVASAQGPGGRPYFGGHSDNPNGPTVSPYMNLLQNSTNGVPQYQTLVKPLIDQQNALKRQGNALQNLQSQVDSGGGSPYGSSAKSGGTGHTTRYMNYSHFYQMRGR